MPITKRPKRREVSPEARALLNEVVELLKERRNRARSIAMTYGDPSPLVSGQTYFTGIGNEIDYIKCRVLDMFR